MNEAERGGKKKAKLHVGWKLGNTERVTLDVFFPHDTTITVAGVPSIYILFKWFVIRTKFFMILLNVFL